MINQRRAPSLSTKLSSGKITHLESSTNDMNVIPFKAARARRRYAEPVRPPAALDRTMPVRRPQASDEVDYRLRMHQNLAAAAVVIVVVVLGAWLIERLMVYSRMQACIEAGHRNCAQLDIRNLPQR
jgi:hypothetical protein